MIAVGRLNCNGLQDLLEVEAGLVKDVVVIAGNPDSRTTVQSPYRCDYLPCRGLPRGLVFLFFRFF